MAEESTGEGVELELPAGEMERSNRKISLDEHQWRTFFGRLVSSWYILVSGSTPNHSRIICNYSDNYNMNCILHLINVVESVISSKMLKWINAFFKYNVGGRGATLPSASHSTY